MGITTISAIGGLSLLLTGAPASAAFGEMIALCAFGASFVALALAIGRLTGDGRAVTPRARLRTARKCESRGKVKGGSPPAPPL